MQSALVIKISNYENELGTIVHLSGILFALNCQIISIPRIQFNKKEEAAEHAGNASSFN